MIQISFPQGLRGLANIVDYKDELTRYYMATAKTLDKEKVIEGVAHLVNPLDNAINWSNTMPLFINTSIGTKNPILVFSNKILVLFDNQ